MEVSLNYYYWHEVAGPLNFYSMGTCVFSEEDIFMLLSSVEPHTTSSESSLTGPYYLEKCVAMVYNRGINYPEASDERLQLMGTDVWVIMSCSKDNEIVLFSMSEIIKMILDIEFDTIEEVSQLNNEMAKNAGQAILNLFVI